MTKAQEERIAILRKTFTHPDDQDEINSIEHNLKEKEEMARLMDLPAIKELNQGIKSRMFDCATKLLSINTSETERAYCHGEMRALRWAIKITNRDYKKEIEEVERMIETFATNA
jgi:hypothetical protein